jgi:hypothetical protein
VAWEKLDASNRAAAPVLIKEEIFIILLPLID